MMKDPGGQIWIQFTSSCAPRFGCESCLVQYTSQHTVHPQISVNAGTYVKIRKQKDDKNKPNGLTRMASAMLCPGTSVQVIDFINVGEHVL